MIHQPHFLPWPGYFARAIASHDVVFLDNVKFKRGHFQQRTRYIDRETRIRWLTLPIKHETRSKEIHDVELASFFRVDIWQRPVVQAYHSHQYFDGVWPDLSRIIECSGLSLMSSTIGTLRRMIALFCEQGDVSLPRTHLSSDLSTSRDRTGRLVQICQALGSTHLIMGKDALASHDVVLLRRSGVSLLEHKYTGSPEEAPPPGVTVLDRVFRQGYGATTRQLLSDWSTPPAVVKDP